MILSLDFNKSNMTGATGEANSPFPSGTSYIAVLFGCNCLCILWGKILLSSAFIESKRMIILGIRKYWRH
jgi:hypothetical protein